MKAITVLCWDSTGLVSIGLFICQKFVIKIIFISIVKRVSILFSKLFLFFEPWEDTFLLLLGMLEWPFRVPKNFLRKRKMICKLRQLSYELIDLRTLLFIHLANFTKNLCVFTYLFWTHNSKCSVWGLVQIGLCSINRNRWPDILLELNARDVQYQDCWANAITIQKDLGRYLFCLLLAAELHGTSQLTKISSIRLLWLFLIEGIPSKQIQRSSLRI